MEVFSIGKGFCRLSKNAPAELSQKEFDRLRVLTIYGETESVKLVCQTFGISRAALYRRYCWLGFIPLLGSIYPWLYHILWLLFAKKKEKQACIEELSKES
jgi:hypothetical protein